MEEPIFNENVSPDEIDSDSPEEAFMRGYSEEEKIEECAECGSALDEEKKIVKHIDGEAYHFCSEDCVEDFEESL